MVRKEKNKMAKRWFEADLEKVADLLAEAKEIIDGLRDE